MSDKIIDITHMKTLKGHDQQLVNGNLNVRIHFVNTADKIIRQVVGKTDFEFTNVFKRALPQEVTSEFLKRGTSLEKAIDDLNILSMIERMIGLNPVIFSPTCTDANMTGWIAGFNMADCMFSSPEMNTEAKARAFNIILFLELRDMLHA